MAGRRSKHLNYWEGLSNYKFRITDQANNAEVTGKTFCWFVLEYDSTLLKFRVKVLPEANSDLTTGVVAQSAETDVSALPATISCLEVGGSGVTATITIAGVR